MKKAYFISDLHLGAPYFSDSRESELRVVCFLDSIKEDCTELYLLGDILDYWYEYRYVVPKGYVRFFGKLAEMADAGVKITWLIGNHDIWMFDYLPQEIGLTVVDGPIEREIMGHRYILAHGDGLGKTPGTFKVLRTLFRNRFCQWLFAGIHPRWTVPFAQRWSRSSREGSVKKESRQGCENTMIWQNEMVENLREWSEGYIKEHPEAECYVFGHLHIARQLELTGGRTMTVLGDWISRYTYGVAEEGKRIRLIGNNGKEIKMEK